MKTSSPIFEVENLRVEREAVILHEVNWRVERGQHWVILGANGSGKTSLLSALTGYLMPSSGEIRIGAATLRRERLARGAALRRARQLQPRPPDRAGPDRARRHPFRPRRADQFLGPRARARRQQQAARILRQVQAAHLADRAWRYLSQGERQRVLIGRALDGAAAPALSRRTGRRTRPRRARGFPAIPRRARRKPPRAHARPRHASRRGNRAALHPRPAAARRQDARRRPEGRSAHLGAISPPPSARPSPCAAPAAATASRSAATPAPSRR